MYKHFNNCKFRIIYFHLEKIENVYDYVISDYQLKIE